MLKKKPELKLPKNAREVPATQGMLRLVRSELKADIRGLRSEMKSGFAKVDARFNQIDARFNQLEARFCGIDSKFNENDSRFNQIDSKLEQILSQVSQTLLIVEEQNSRNKVALEGLTNLFQRQSHLEVRQNDVESVIQGLAARSRR